MNGGGDGGAKKKASGVNPVCAGFLLLGHCVRSEAKDGTTVVDFSPGTYSRANYPLGNYSGVDLQKGYRLFTRQSGIDYLYLAIDIPSCGGI